jgi:serine-type D-Ala-D-Ala carboxypeptidase/endopeptidase (penicillin-binding protein 4)
MDWDMFRCFNSKPNSISANFEDGDLDVVGNDNLLVFLTAYDQHSIPLPKSSLSLGETRTAKNTNTFNSALQISKAFWHTGRVLHMKKYFFSTTWLILFLFSPTYAQQTSTRSESPSAEARPNLPTRLPTVSESNYLTQLALKGFNLETQGLLIESLDAHTVYAELNSNVGFNPASVIKVATSFAALATFGPEYHFETSFYSDGPINKKTRTLSGNLILQSTGDPILSSIDMNRLLRDVVRSGITRVSGDLVIVGPFTYGVFSSTDRATKALAVMVRRVGIKVGGRTNVGTVRGTRIATHVSPSLQDVLFYQNAHSVNGIAERLGEALGGPKAVEKFLIKDIGIAPSDVTISHCSGLDYNRITPRATVTLFRELVFWLNLNDLQPQDVLPVAGVDRGTLQRRFTGQEYRGAVIGKTGTLPGTDGGVSTLAGVMYTRDYGPVLFAIFNTKGSVSTYRKLQDDFLKGFLAESGGLPDANASLHRLNN